MKSPRGLKLDDGKLAYDLIDEPAEAEMVAVLTFGSVKYDPGNWKHVEPRRYVAAARRHIACYRMGEELDPETGLHHLACASCCIHFVLALALASPRGQKLAQSLPTRLARALVVARKLRAQRESSSKRARRSPAASPKKKTVTPA